MDIAIATLKHALLITAFVFMMMLLIEYVNVLTRGVLTEGLRRGGWQAYILAVLLGATPGCLGAFAVVTLYEHGIVSMGALTATMIATSGDEAFVMLAMIPRSFAVLTGVLIAVALGAGVFLDWCLRHCRRLISAPTHTYQVHGEACPCYPRGQILQQWRECTLARASLAATIGLFLGALLTGEVGPGQWNWIRVTLLLASAISLFIVCTVPEHFLQEHLWEHVVKQHVPRIFLWTFGALLLTALANQHLHLEQLVEANPLTVLVLAALVGIIPQSGPHLFFVTLYAQGAIPFSILLTSSVVQDGHGMLPLLAHSRRDFIVVKTVNLIVGLLLGLVVLATGW